MQTKLTLLQTDSIMLHIAGHFGDVLPGVNYTVSKKSPPFNCL